MTHLESHSIRTIVCGLEFIVFVIVYIAFSLLIYSSTLFFICAKLLRRCHKASTFCLFRWRRFAFLCLAMRDTVKSRVCMWYFWKRKVAHFAFSMYLHISIPFYSAWAYHSARTCDVLLFLLLFRAYIRVFTYKVTNSNDQTAQKMPRA